MEKDCSRENEKFYSKQEMVEKDVVEMEWRLDHAQSQIVLVITSDPFEIRLNIFIHNIYEQTSFYDHQISI